MTSQWGWLWLRGWEVPLLPRGGQFDRLPPDLYVDVLLDPKLLSVIQLAPAWQLLCMGE